MKRIMLLTLAGLILATAPAGAHTWKIDPHHSGIMFEVKHIYSQTRGQFNEFSGVMQFDPAAPEKAKFDFEVSVDSIDTRIPKRDNHLRSPDFFDAARFPKMRFVSGKDTPAGDNRFFLDGKLTIRDVTKDFRVEFIFFGETESPFQKGTMVGGFETRFEIDRLDFHVGSGKFHKMGVVDKSVRVLISLEATRAK